MDPQDELRTELEQARGNEAYAFLAIHRFLIAIGIDRRLLKPLDDHLNKLMNAEWLGPYGGNARPLLETIRLARAAALIVVLRETGGCDLATALQYAATGTNLDPAELKKFRNNLSRGRASAVARAWYEVSLEEARGLQTEWLRRQGVKPPTSSPL